MLLHATFRYHRSFYTFRFYFQVPSLLLYHLISCHTQGSSWFLQIYHFTPRDGANERTERTKRLRTRVTGGNFSGLRSEVRTQGLRTRDYTTRQISGLRSEARTQGLRTRGYTTRQASGLRSEVRTQGLRTIQLDRPLRGRALQLTVLWYESGRNNNTDNQRRGRTHLCYDSLQQDWTKIATTAKITTTANKRRQDISAPL